MKPELNVNKKDFDNLTRLYQSWTTEQLKTAISHHEDYQPDALSILKNELASRKIVPLVESAVMESTPDGFFVTFRRDRKLFFPLICPNCSSRTEIEVKIESKGRTSWFCPLPFIWVTKHVAVTVPFCRKCIRIRFQIGYIAAALLGLFASGIAFRLAGSWVAGLAVGIIFSVSMYRHTIRRDPRRVISIPTFDEHTITFKILNKDWALKFVEANNASTTKVN